MLVSCSSGLTLLVSCSASPPRCSLLSASSSLTRFLLSVLLSAAAATSSGCPGPAIPGLALPLHPLLPAGLEDAILLSRRVGDPHSESERLVDPRCHYCHCHDCAALCLRLARFTVHISLAAALLLQLHSEQVVTHFEMPGAPPLHRALKETSLSRRLLLYWTALYRGLQHAYVARPQHGTH